MPLTQNRINYFYLDSGCEIRVGKERVYELGMPVRITNVSKRVLEQGREVVLKYFIQVRWGMYFIRKTRGNFPVSPRCSHHIFMSSVIYLSFYTDARQNGIYLFPQELIVMGPWFRIIKRETILKGLLFFCFLFLIIQYNWKAGPLPTFREMK